MEKTFAKVEELVGNVKEYVNTRIESVKFNAAEKSSIVIANVVAGLVAAVVFIFFLGFASIALAFWLSNLIGSPWSGFLIVSGFYLLTGIIIWFGRGKFIRMPVMNALISQLFKHDEQD